MTCLSSPPAGLFDSVLGILEVESFESEPPSIPLGLFEFHTDAAPRQKQSVSIAVEEDLERWDGLS
jgi:hypothetical protein